VARWAIEGLGDRALGQWIQTRKVAYHMRRRVTPVEENIVGAVLDIRNTAEVIVRVDRLLEEWPNAPERFRQAVLEEPF